MKLYLVRHPEPEVAPGICYGQLDVPARHPATVADGLRKELPEEVPVWTSPRRRCLELARLLHPAPQVDERLAEMDFGVWEGLPWHEVPKEELDAWALDVSGYVPPGGESAEAMQRRALAFVASLTVPEAILVTHSGVIRTLMANWQGLPPERWCELSFAYGSVTRVTLAD